MLDLAFYSDESANFGQSRRTIWNAEVFFQRKFILAAVERYQLKLLVYDVQQEAIAPGR
ncbi:MAG TPA: hypothetical protein V6D02_01670 [Candidatus Obscuribacterales bacterium]